MKIKTINLICDFTFVTDKTIVNVFYLVIESRNMFKTLRFFIIYTFYFYRMRISIILCFLFVPIDTVDQIIKSML